MLLNFVLREYISDSFFRYSHLSFKQLLTLVFLISFIGALLFLPHPSLAGPNSSSISSTRESLMKQGSLSFQRGNFEEAVSEWKEAAKLCEKEGNAGKQSEVLVLIGQAYQYVGQYSEALKSLQSALVLAEKSGDRVRIASALGSLGNVYITIGPADRAYEYLNKGLTIARELENPALQAVIANNLGNLFATQQKYDESIRAYLDSMEFSKRSGNPSLVARTLANSAIAYFHKGSFKESKTLLDKALDQTRRLEHSHEKAYGLISIGLTYYRLCQHLSDQNDLLRLSSKAFEEAAVVAEITGDLRSLSYAWGYRGALAEYEKRYPEALNLTRRAILTLQPVAAPELLYLWQWQTGRLLKGLGQNKDAISAYRSAVSTLESIRYEMSTCYGSPRLSFRESAQPIYFEFVDLLLQYAASMQNQEQEAPYLMEARETIELLKAAELRDYFKDECVDAAQSKKTNLDAVSKTAVVVYPVILSDRTELLVSFPTGLKRFSVHVEKETLTREIQRFRWALEKRTTREYLPHAQALYDWLIRPLEPDLKSLTSDTLVFVPDGPLRMIPMAALHDGKEFLLSKYAIAVTPGLNLTDPRPVKREDIKVLSAGITDSVQGFPPLPYVSIELQAIQRLYGGTPLINRQFLTSRLEKELREKLFSVVHIASHGIFESDIAKTFLLTYDSQLTMDQLNLDIGLMRFRETPIELLTLSACETAVGDDRAALGLAGIAIKAGARSALATLWYINDHVSSELVAEFYRQLKDPSISRATALQRAQLKLLDDLWYQHPGYWSPFLLINNWL